MINKPFEIGNGNVVGISSKTEYDAVLKIITDCGEQTEWLSGWDASIKDFCFARMLTGTITDGAGLRSRAYNSITPASHFITQNQNLTTCENSK